MPKAVSKTDAGHAEALSRTMNELFQTITESIRRGQTVALATVIDRKGSLPMSKRAKMLAFADGTIMGTIGGGKLEAEVIQAARKLIQDGSSQILAFDLTADQIEADGLTCGGTVEIFLECFTPDTSSVLLKEMLTAYSDARPAAVVTLLDADGSGSLQTADRKMVIYADGTAKGTSGIPTLDADIIQLALPRIGHDYLQTITLEVPDQPAHTSEVASDTHIRIFLETVIPHPTAYLFGGGHISRCLSSLLSMIGFDFVVIDDRQEFADLQRFPEAKACLVSDFAGVFEELTFDPNFAYIIIVTRGHQSDQLVLEQAIQTGAKYIGMIGSRRKIRLMFEHLQQQGIPESLTTIHAPIGLEIGADTPEEIAISIAAELVKIRRTNH
jgi:xanthine dehydrogenase accessory factor